MLFHYTSQMGLIGILQAHGIWATQTHFLNDSSEFGHALNFAKRVAGDDYYMDDYHEAFGWALRAALGKVSGDDVFVSSFSERPDLLSQWRGYCPGGSGFCLGFEKSAIHDFCDENGFSLQKCIYDPDEQHAKIRELAVACLQMFPSDGVTREEYDEMGSKAQVDRSVDLHEFVSKGPGKIQADAAVDWFCKEIAEIAPLFKNNGFHEEAEWRVIARNPSAPLKFRSGTSYVIPYIELGILAGTKKDILREVIVGPNPNQYRCKKGAGIILSSLGYDKAEVFTSAIPFNNW